jgi:hypothetical protein
VTKHHASDAELEALGWPPLLTTPRAVAYTGISKGAILYAARAGTLPIAGRRGRVYVFRRADLDAWLLGAEPDESKPLAPVVPITAPRFRRPVSESLARIKAAAGRSEDK